MSTAKVLLTGATGYIGGTLLTRLLQSDHPTLKELVFTCLVRGEDRVSKLKSSYGDRVNPVLYKDLDDIEKTVEVASEHDIIINTALGYHSASSEALVRGLAQRKETVGKDVYIIHTSGTSNLADQPISKAYTEAGGVRIFDDATDDIYAYEKGRNAQTVYGQRTSELGVIDVGLETGVKTIVIMSPTIYGTGTGNWNKSSIQIPAYVAATLTNGQAVVVGDGKGIWDNVHVEDLAVLYELVLRDIIEREGRRLPFGKKGIIFSGVGEHSWMGVAQSVADVALDRGLIKTNHVKSVGLEEGAAILTGPLIGKPEGDQLLTELGLSSNSRTRSSVARGLALVGLEANAR